MDFERVRSYWVAKVGTWLALDFESWEREHSMLLEVGWSLFQWDDEGKEVNTMAHLIVKERMQYQNGTYVQGNRDVSCVDGRLHYTLLRTSRYMSALQLWSKRAGSQKCREESRSSCH